MAEAQLQLRFKRNDLWSTVTTHRGTMRVLPAGKKSRQKIVVGDTTGVVNCFGVGKHHEIKPEFVTPKPPTPSECTYIALYKDQLFLAVGQRISAYTKKGKPFFVNETNLSDPIRHMSVDTPFLCTAGDYVLTHFQEVSERGFFISPDKINDLATIPRDDAGNIDVYVASQDRTVRCVRKTDMRHQMGCEAPVTALCINGKEGNDVHDATTAARDLIYGTQAGTVGGLRATVEGLGRRFSAVPKTRASQITTITTADMSQSGVKDVILGRDDGTIEVHSFERNPDNTPVVAWTGTVNEYVTTIDTGNVTHAERLDIAVCTFTGKLISFSINDDDAMAAAAVPQVLTAAPAELAATPQQAVAQGIKNTQGDQGDSASIVRAKIDEAMAQITELRRQVHLKKTEFAGLDASTKKVASEKLRAIAPTFTMKEKVHLDAGGFVNVGVELDTVLDSVNIAAYVDFEVVNENGANGAADDVRVSVTKPSQSPGSKAKFLASYKCPTDSTTTRLEMKLKPIEGQQGELHLYVTPRTMPKSVLKRVIEIPPLSMHMRKAEPDAGAPDPTADPTLSLARVTGPFTIKDAHAWLYRGFFDVPQNVFGDEGRLTFENVFVGSMLYVRYRKGEVEAYSHNYSALATWRDFLTKEAARRKVQIALDFRASNDSLPVVLKLLDPTIGVQARQVRASKVLEGLKEIQAQEESVTFLSPEYKELLAEAAATSSTPDAASQQQAKLHYVLGVLERLLQDRSTFRGANHVSPQRIQELHHFVTNNYSLQGLIAFFGQS